MSCNQPNQRCPFRQRGACKFSNRSTGCYFESPAAQEAWHASPVVEFKGICTGIRLTARGEHDPVVMFSMLVEDDGHWAETQSNNVCTYWLRDFRTQITRATRWLQRFCQYNVGWMFPETIDEWRQRS